MPLKVETPKNLDSIFNLDAFKYNEMKALFKNIYGILEKFGARFDQLEKFLDDIPHFDEALMKDLEKRMTEAERK